MNALSTTENVQECLNQIGAGDESARGRLIEHCHRRLQLHVRKMLRVFPDVRRREESGDVLQNVFLRLDRTLRQIPVPTARDFFQLAAFHIRLEILDLIQEQRHRPDLEIEPPDRAASEDDPGKLEMWRLIHEFIARLPEGERSLFDQLWYVGLTQPEATRVLGIPLDTLKKRWQSARLRLRERFPQLSF